VRTFPRSDLFKRGSTREFYFYSAKKAVCDCPVMLTKGVVQEASRRYQKLYRKYIRAKDEGATHKAWQASGGVNSRRSHNKINGLEIKIDDYFSINGAKLFLPNDPIAPIDETANCDCDVRYVKKKPALRRETPTSIRLEKERLKRERCEQLNIDIPDLTRSVSDFNDELRDLAQEARILVGRVEKETNHQGIIDMLEIALTSVELLASGGTATILRKTILDAVRQIGMILELLSSTGETRLTRLLDKADRNMSKYLDILGQRDNIERRLPEFIRERDRLGCPKTDIVFNKYD
jgi:hypothetical protein